MRSVKKPEKRFVAVLMALIMLVSAFTCALAVDAKVTDQSLAPAGAGNYYLWGVNSNDPDFGAMSSPTGSFSYDGTKGYYYYDLHGASGDYCFVVSKVNNSGNSAAKSPAVGGVQNAGKYYLTQGNYHGYACMHLWNPAGDDVRIYFTSENAGLNAIPVSEAGDTPTTPVTPTVKPTTTPPVTSGYIYCENAAGWGTVYAYLWNSDSDKNADWPGVKMTNIGGNTWRCQVTKSYANIIFNNGTDQVKTADMSYPGSGKVYNNATAQWSTYGGSTDPTSAPTTPNPTTPTPTTAPTTPSGKLIVYCDNAAGWSTVNAYMWNSESDKNTDWPGAKMTKVGGNIWQYILPKNYAKIIFSESGNNQTPDLTFPGSGYMYNNKTNKWSIYDTSPLQVQSITTDLESPQFNEVAVTMSAQATGQGTVFYKFSATNTATGGTAVVADYSVKNSAIWIPKSVGTYTLTYEFKDTAGNTNKRTTSFKIEDGLKSVTPYIKQVTPASGQIKKSTACSVSVKAGGGVTGTNLLFYKFVLKDSAGKTINVPYYTRAASCSFTPSSLGNYTLEVSVQGSNNETVTRTYVYNSVNTIVEPTNPAVMPTVKPGSLIGDADGDGEVTILDATRIQRFLAELITSGEIDMSNADADHDGEVSILDATRIQRYLADLVTSL